MKRGIVWLATKHALKFYRCFPLTRIFLPPFPNLFFVQRPHPHNRVVREARRTPTSWQQQGTQQAQHVARGAAQQGTRTSATRGWGTAQQPTSNGGSKKLKLLQTYRRFRLATYLMHMEMTQVESHWMDCHIIIFSYN